MADNASVNTSTTFSTSAVVPRLLVVFPCLNEEATIEKLVRSFDANLQNLPVQLVIVDGDSTDQTPKIAAKLAAENPRVKFLRNTRRLQSAAVNLAVERFGDSADFIIRIDAHADYPKDYCQKLVTEALAQEADSVVVAMRTEGRTKFQKAVALAQNSVLGNGGSRHRAAGGQGQWVDHGHHALMRIAAFRAVGGYDDTFSHNEDAELDHRLGVAGYKIWLTAITTMIYYPRAKPLALLRQYYNYGYGRARNITKNRIQPKIRQLLPAFVMPVTVLALLTPISWIFVLPALLWAGLCIGYGAKIASDKKQPDLALLVGPAAMIMHWGWSAGFLSFLLSGKRG